jgi:lipopolysaccharide/colanic/teichoic acid biosynthesis glycosyltransferase
MDVAFSIFFLIISSPLIVLSVLLIKLTSAGPVFYCALRAGRRGVLFPCCKLRTMVAGADQLKDQLRSRNERQGPFFKLSDDPRVTSIGRFLRRYSIDELPQLWNVLKGEMSLVGPRPHPADEARRYEHWHLRRLEVTPGLTGLWQVTARRDPSFQRNMDLDVTYIDHWSLALDWQILRRTMWVVLQGSGR